MLVISGKLYAFCTESILRLGIALDIAMRSRAEYEAGFHMAMDIISETNVVGGIPNEERPRILAEAKRYAAEAGIPYQELSPLNQFIVTIPPYVFCCLQNYLPDDEDLRKEAQRLIGTKGFPRYLQEELGLAISRRIKGAFWRPSLLGWLGKLVGGLAGAKTKKKDDNHDIVMKKTKRVKRVSKHVLSPRTTIGSESRLKGFPLLYLYFDSFADLVKAWHEGCLEAARHDSDIRSKDMSLNEIMKDEALFLNLYENNLVRLRLGDGTELRRDSEEDYWDRATHPEKYSDDLQITNPQLTDDMKQSLIREHNRLKGLINTTVEMIKRRYGL